MSGAAAAFDRAATLAAYAQTTRKRKNNRSESLSHRERMEALGALADLYRGAHADWFRAPRNIAPRERRVRDTAAGGAVVDLAWNSDYTPYIGELSDRYNRTLPNRMAAVRMWRHPGGGLPTKAERRPTLILIHGYLAGQYAVEERMWPSRYFHHKLGFDLAFFTLPFHGPRAVSRRFGAPPWPGSDPRVSNEGFRQAIGDLRDFVAWLQRRGHEAIGVMGMSLGGYTTSLAATCESALSFAVPVIPLASVADFARDQGRLGTNATEEALEHEALDKVHQLVSPLHRPLSIDNERVLIVAAEADRITPVAHAERLAKHFDVELQTWHGGHLLQFGRREKFRRIGRFLDGLGVTRRAVPR